MPKTLLLADDSVTIQKVVGISFANEDVVLLTVDNGDDAIARAREARPDLVLADILMPGKDGYEVCEAIKSEPDLRHVPVLLLSGTFENFDEERARRAGADGHITKPFEAQALVDQVNELLARSTPSPASADATMLVSEADLEESHEAYDFFDEEMAQTAPSPPRRVRQEAVTVNEVDEFGLAGDGLELEAAVEEDLRPMGAPVPPALPPAADPSATVLLDEPDDQVQGVAAPSPSYDDAFDFSFDGAEEAAPAAVRPEAPRAPLAVEPEQPRFAPAIDDPLLSADAEPTRFEPPTPPPVPQPAVEVPVRAAAPAPVSLSAGLSEGMRQQLHETLEKVAWEAFGDLSERIVREALERIEAVAWEVIPQMAETLIREEIRRLKGDD